MEARVILSLEAEGREEVSIQEIATRAGASPSSARRIAHHLVRKGWIQRLRRGSYLLNPSRNGPEAIRDTDPYRIGGRLVRPAYFGFASAAELWGLLPQASRIYYVATPMHDRPRTPQPAEFRFVHLRPDRFFGFTETERRGSKITVSDLEKTVLDCLDRPEYAGGLPGVVRILAEAKPKIDWGRLRRYLTRWDSRSLERRLGYLLERVKPDSPAPRSWLRALRPPPGGSPVPLGPPRYYGRWGHADLRWRVIENVPPRELFAELDVR